MPIFIKPGYWSKKIKQLKGELNLSLIIQELVSSSITNINNLISSINQIIVNIQDSLTILEVRVQIVENDIINSAPKYNSYTATINQSGVFFPSQGTVFQNNLGPIDFLRDDIGVYRMISNNLFIDGQTFIIIGQPQNANRIYSIQQLDKGNIVFTQSSNTEKVDDFDQLHIEIRVYL